jgi:hypothetical protein
MSSLIRVVKIVQRKKQEKNQNYEDLFLWSHNYPIRTLQNAPSTELLNTQKSKSGKKTEQKTDIPMTIYDDLPPVGRHGEEEEQQQQTTCPEPQESHASLVASLRY